jgi:cytochrome c oxidase assembly protein subunit 15
VQAAKERRERRTVNDAERRTWSRQQRWANALALLTWSATVLLLCVGGLVTSYDVGMAVPDWPTTFGQNMFLYDWLSASAGVKIEHGHRLLGSLVGMLTLALTVALLFDERSWMRWMGVAAFVAVVLQGVLGGMRVELNAMFQRRLAVIHGITAQMFLAQLMAIVCWTSRRWCCAATLRTEDARRLRTLAATLAATALFQGAAGAWLRHFGAGLLIHLFVAGVLFMLVLWTTVPVLLDAELRRVLVRPARWLLGLLVLQLSLGTASLAVVSFQPPGFGPPTGHLEAWLTTVHLVAGALVLSACVAFLLASVRFVAPAADSAAPMEQSLIGAVG